MIFERNFETELFQRGRALDLDWTFLKSSRSGVDVANGRRAAPLDPLSPAGADIYMRLFSYYGTVLVELAEACFESAR